MKHITFVTLLFIAVLLYSSCVTADDEHSVFNVPPHLDDTQPSQHQDNWAILVSSSKYWHNFRQSNNVFLTYQLLKQNDFPDDKILVFVSENHACDRRNPDSGFAPCSRDTLFPAKSLFGPEVEVDFEGYNADAQTFLRILYGTQAPGTPLAKQLRSNEKSNVLFLLSSHSGEYFTKFQDYEFLTAFELNHAFQQMYRLKKYHRLVFIVDTCKASTLFDMIDAPNIVAVSSSGPTDDGRSHSEHFNTRLAQHTHDALSSEIFDYAARNMKKSVLNNAGTKRVDSGNINESQRQEIEQPKLTSSATLRDLFQSLKRNRKIDSNVSFSHMERDFSMNGLRDPLASGNWLMSDFFVYRGQREEEERRNSRDIRRELEGDFVFWEGF